MNGQINNLVNFFSYSHLVHLASLEVLKGIIKSRKKQRRRKPTWFTNEKAETVNHQPSFKRNRPTTPPENMEQVFEIRVQVGMPSAEQPGPSGVAKPHSAGPSTDAVDSSEIDSDDAGKAPDSDGEASAESNDDDEATAESDSEDEANHENINPLYVIAEPCFASDNYAAGDAYAFAEAYASSDGEASDEAETAAEDPPVIVEIIEAPPVAEFIEIRTADGSVEAVPTEPTLAAVETQLATESTNSAGATSTTESDPTAEVPIKVTPTAHVVPADQPEVPESKPGPAGDI